MNREIGISACEAIPDGPPPNSNVRQWTLRDDNAGIIMELSGFPSLRCI